MRTLPKNLKAMKN